MPINNNIGIDLDGTIISNITDRIIYKTGVPKYLPLLFNKGFNLHLITARSNEKQVYKIANAIENELGIRFTSVTLTYNGKKGSYAGNLNCGVMIDNTKDYLIGCRQNGVIPIYLSRHNNKVHPDWIHCKDWYDIISYLLN